MKTKIICAAVAFHFLMFANTALTNAAQGRLDTTKIEQLTGIKGEMNEKEGVFTVRAPRTDLQVTTAGVKMNPAMGLTSYAAFMKAGAKTMVMGDTTLLEDQVNPVMSVALENGLEVTALHNHFFWDSPKVMFMHIGGMGDEEKLASAVGKVFAKIKETSGGKGEIPKADLDPANTSLDPKTSNLLLAQRARWRAEFTKLLSDGRRKWEVMKLAIRWVSIRGRPLLAAINKRWSMAIS